MSEYLFAPPTLNSSRAVIRSVAANATSQVVVVDTADALSTSIDTDIAARESGAGDGKDGGDDGEELHVAGIWGIGLVWKGSAWPGSNGGLGKLTWLDSWLVGLWGMRLIVWCELLMILEFGWSKMDSLYLSRFYWCCGEHWAFDSIIIVTRQKRGSAMSVRSYDLRSYHSIIGKR